MACCPPPSPQPRANLLMGTGLPGSRGHFEAGFPIGTVSHTSKVEGGGKISLFPELRRRSQGRAGSQVTLLSPGFQCSKTWCFARCQALSNFLSLYTAFKQLKALSLSSSLAQQPPFLRSYLNHGFFTSLVEKPGVPPTMHWSAGSQTAQG